MAHLTNSLFKRSQRAAFFSILLLISVTVLGCSRTNPPELSVSTPEAVSSTATQRPSELSVTKSIRSVDFANFAYPAKYMFTTQEKDFTLQQGKFTSDDKHNAVSLAYVAFGDVTGDGLEDAMVTLAPVLTGSATPLVTYIYTLSDNQPHFLWAFRTGDRADGGLRRVFSENGKLVVERFSPEGSRGACCPVAFLRQHYTWNGKEFQTVGSAEVLPNPSGNAETIVP